MYTLPYLRTDVDTEWGDDDDDVDVNTVLALKTTHTSVRTLLEHRKVEPLRTHLQVMKV